MKILLGKIFNFPKESIPALYIDGIGSLPIIKEEEFDCVELDKKQLKKLKKLIDKELDHGKDAHIQRFSGSET